MAKIFGIDTNHHHPISDWDKVKEFLYEKNSKSSYGFVMVRLGYSNTSGNGGLVLDRIAIDSLKKCNELKIPCGVYVYSYDKSTKAAIKTMQEALDTIKRFDVDYPVVYDIEYEPFNKTCGKAVNTSIAIAAMQVIESAGYYGMIYASRDFFKNYMYISDLSKYDKWEAAYTTSDTVDIPNGMWQFTSKGSVPGISGNVDFNYSYKDYKELITKSGLNNKEETATNCLYNILVKSASKGDKDYIVSKAENLGLSCEVTEVK